MQSAIVPSGQKIYFFFVLRETLSHFDLAQFCIFRTAFPRTIISVRSVLLLPGCTFVFLTIQQFFLLLFNCVSCSKTNWPTVKLHTSYLSFHVQFILRIGWRVLLSLFRFTMLFILVTFDVYAVLVSYLILSNLITLQVNFQLHSRLIHLQKLINNLFGGNEKSNDDQQFGQ